MSESNHEAANKAMIGRHRVRDIITQSFVGRAAEHCSFPLLLRSTFWLDLRSPSRPLKQGIWTTLDTITNTIGCPFIHSACSLVVHVHLERVCTKLGGNEGEEEEDEQLADEGYTRECGFRWIIQPTTACNTRYVSSGSRLQFTGVQSQVLFMLLYFF